MRGLTAWQDAIGFECNGRVTCPWCDGSGYDVDERCSTCFGLGEVACECCDPVDEEIDQLLVDINNDNNGRTET